MILHDLYYGVWTDMDVSCSMTYWQHLQDTNYSENARP